MADDVELLVCKCEQCTHWEIGIDKLQRGFLLCKSCGLTLPMDIARDGVTTAMVLDDHHMLHWAKHER